MIKILQISVEVNKNSVGKIAEQVGLEILKNNWESYIAFSRGKNKSKSKLIKIGGIFNFYFHAIESRIFDNHGFSSRFATKRFIRKIDKLKPDIIHFHGLHGYYINIAILFKYINNAKIPVVWTHHDCWAFTGHCAFFDNIGCEKWKSNCFSCEQIKDYPKSFFIDNSKNNFINKKSIFTSISNLNHVVVSDWLYNYLKLSFLGSHNIKTIKNGIDLNLFSPLDCRSELIQSYNIENKKIILGVASKWDRRKGLSDIYKLNAILNHNNFQIILVGLSKEQRKKLPSQIIGIERIDCQKQLVELYSTADVFINPTNDDTYPTTNLESIACGTPVVTYNTGGSVESINQMTGIVVAKNNIDELMRAIITITEKDRNIYKKECRNFAKENFDKDLKFHEYIELYKSILDKSNEN